LIKVTFSDGATLQTIEPSAFFRCTNLRELELPSTVHTIKGSEGRCTAGAFAGCTNLHVLTLPYALTSLGADAFTGSTANLRLLTVPFAVPAAAATTVATMLGPLKGNAPSAKRDHVPQLDLSAVSTV
jgi:hypothetical protein